MTFPQWVRMPSNWIRHEQGLLDFSWRDLGISVTALKLYAALLAVAGSEAAKKNSPGNVARMTYSDLEIQCGASRGMLPRALKQLENRIKTEPGMGRSPNQYVIPDLPAPKSGGWAKLPALHLMADSRLSQFNPRSRADLAALKLYFLFLAFRDNQSSEAVISYKRIADYTGLTRTDISKGKSRLISAELIGLYSGRDPERYRDDEAYWYNRYFIRGLTRGAREAALE